ncbi:hypothetical protein F511_18367 [Dorcoceras hygrometricum]|uniref:Uncharacterized protein n=1 Tax=Dorcoceras hygrometricum TaxID=472368 RepID=A0A2Z7C273_9LAMI|nr:hypothetical protein F511_18367 [Dorcoceras hygrometricum]
MPYSSNSVVRSAAETLYNVPISPKTYEPMLPDQAELASSGRPWYEGKASTLKVSDIPLIKEKGGMTYEFNVVLPGPERAHYPPPDFYSLYVNQLDMGLWFPIPKFITVLCQYLGVIPSQLAPNSYSFHLSLGVLLSFFEVPLTTYVLMQLIHVKRLGPGKLYLSHKGDLRFIGGNLSSHKGWMSRFFFVRRVGRRRYPWRCDIFYRKNENRESNAGRRRVRRRTIANALEARDLRAGRAREAHAGRDDGRRLLAGSRTRRRTVAHRLGDDARMAARWPRACAARLHTTGRLLLHSSSTHCAMMAGDVPPRSDAHWRCGAMMVDARCALDARWARNVVRRRMEFLVCGGRRSVEFSGDVVTAGLILVGFGSGLSRAAREVFGPVCNVGPGFDRF